MGDILPDGGIQGYSNYCQKCGKTIKVNIQGNETGNHNCVPSECKETSTFKDQFGNEKYFICNKPVKFKVEFNEGGRSARKEKHVCGIHCNSIKKWDKRLREKTSFNPDLVITEVL